MIFVCFCCYIFYVQYYMEIYIVFNKNMVKIKRRFDFRMEILDNIMLVVEVWLQLQWLKILNFGIFVQVLFCKLDIMYLFLVLMILKLIEYIGYLMLLFFFGMV